MLPSRFVAGSLMRGGRFLVNDVRVSILGDKGVDCSVAGGVIYC